MEILQQLWSFVLHIDQHLFEIVQQYGTLTYIILFFIIFSETGFVVTPFLPGDSLLFAAGALAGTGQLNVWLIIILLLTAAFCGNMLNYSIGRYLGPRVLENNKIPFIKQEHLEKTQLFYAKYGAKAVVISRFLPFLRTFVPFVAGIGKMSVVQFTLYNFIGAALWIIPFTLAGFGFGNIPLVKKNFSLVVLGIIFITALPTFVAIGREWLKNRRQKAV